VHSEIKAMNLEIKDRQRDLFGGFHKAVLQFEIITITTKAETDMHESDLSVMYCWECIRG
jgi:hypothetical protein